MGHLAPGTRIGDYVIEAPLGQGAMGAVYRARRALDGGVVAIKTLSAGIAATDEQRKRFEREALLAARLSHPHIVKVHASGVQGFTSWLAMDLIEGRPLSDLVGRVTPAEAARLVAQVARAIAHAHAHGVVHRDLKPANVLVHDGRAFVADFGIARPVEDSTRLTRTGALVGTPTYLSPEQATGGEVGPPSDVHALGVLLHELLTGAPPFVAGDIVSLLAAIVDGKPRPASATVPGVPRAIDDALRAALEKDPARRPSASGLAALLEAPPSRRPPARGVAAGVALACLCVAGALLAPGDEPPPVAPAPPPDAPSPRVARTSPPREAPRVEPPWTPPAWVRGLETRGDPPAVAAAYAAAARPDELDPRAVARAVAALERLDAAWKEPAMLDAERSTRLAELVRLHATWLRFDPAHRMSPQRAAVVADSWAWVITLRASPDDVHETVLALMQLTPEDVGVYVAYARVTRGVERDLAVLRRGLRLAVSRGDGPAEASIARELANDLLESVRLRPPGVPGAPDELLALGRDFARRPDPLPSDLAHVLLLAAQVPAMDVAEARALAAKAEEAIGLSRASREARYELELHQLRRARDPEQRDVVIRAAEAYLQAVGGDGAHDDYARGLADQVAALHREAGRPEEAIASRRRVLASVGPTALPDVALRLAVELATDGADDATLAAALVDLARRLDARAAELRVRGDRAASLVEAARAAVDAAAPGASAERLAPWLARPDLRAALVDTPP